MEKKEDVQEEYGMCEDACGQCGMCGGCGEYEGGGMGHRRMYGMHCGGRHYLLRWVLGILILTFVFIAGIKIGEFKQDMRANGYGYRMMDRGYDTMPGYGMMQQWRAVGTDGGAYDRYGMMRGTGVAAPVAPTQ